MITKKLKIALVILLLPIMVLATECTTFTDIDGSSYKSDILVASDEGWISCRDTFEPYRATNRIEALKMVIVASGVNPPATTEQCFDDVPTGDWMNPYVCYGKNSGLLVNRSSFSPADSVNFAEASKLILRTLTHESYSETSTNWYDGYLAKMSLYGFKLAPSATINRDYFVYMVRTIQADPNKQPATEEPQVEEPTTQENETPTVEEPTNEQNNTTTQESNSSNEDTTEAVNEVAQGGFEHWFEPYRCFDTTAPALDLKVENNTQDSNNNRILDLEYFTSGGTQSCIDTEGESHELSFGTMWRGDGVEFGDLTSAEDKSIYKYKKVRVTIPNGKATTIKLAVITSLGKVMVTTLSINEAGEIIQGETIVYGLNGKKITNETIISKIKDAIAKLEAIKKRLDALLDFNTNLRANDKLKQEFDAIKKELDDAKKSIDDIKQAIDNTIADNDEKDALKKEADGIKKAIDDIKKMIDGYKQDEDNSQSAIDRLKAEIDKVIAMMRSGEVITAIENKIAIPKGRSLISGNIAIDNLSDAIYAIWIVDNAKWYGYSPHTDVQEQIKAKYRLIEGSIPPHKAVLVWATEDTTIDVGDDTPIEATHIYGNSLSMHGADNIGLSITGVECSQPNYTMIAAIKLMGDMPTLFMPDRVHETLESFSNIYQNDGYFVLCEKE
ncbi:MAG: hypothetical protein KU38_06320 [Sulfurovum sp. FS08-3]|nr:MAG: hypothetical protein KU38_06320 [Sulfurovum sp. FS08-3]